MDKIKEFGSRHRFSQIPLVSWIALALLFIFMGWCLYLFFDLSKEYKIALITFVGSIAGLSYTHNRNKERENMSRLFAAKSEAYKKMFDLVGSMMDKDESKHPTEEQIVERFIEIKKDMLVWGSERTIKAFNELCAGSNKKNIAVETALKVNTLLLEMRRDLGHNDKTLNHYELIGLYIKADEKERFFNQENE
jgi:hypothetical protein